MTATSIFHSLRKDLALEAAHHHVPAQAWRLARMFAATLAAQVLSGAPIAGWADLWSLLVACGEATLRQLRKTMPVPAAQRVVDEHEDVITASAQPPAGG